MSASLLIAEELSPQSSRPWFNFEVFADGANRDELIPAIADVDAILVRSARRSTRKPSQPRSA